MLEPYTTEIRQDLAAARMAALRHSARPSPAGVLRRTVGNGLVRLGLHLGGDGSVPAVDLHSESAFAEALAPARASEPFLPARRALPQTAGDQFVTVSAADIERELAAPFGIRSARPAPRGRARTGTHPGTRSARHRASRLAMRFDAS